MSDKDLLLSEEECKNAIKEYNRRERVILKQIKDGGVSPEKARELFRELGTPLKYGYSANSEERVNDAGVLYIGVPFEGILDAYKSLLTGSKTEPAGQPPQIT